MGLKVPKFLSTTANVSKDVLYNKILEREKLSGEEKFEEDQPCRQTIDKVHDTWRKLPELMYEKNKKKFGKLELQLILKRLREMELERKEKGKKMAEEDNN